MAISIGKVVLEGVPVSTNQLYRAHSKSGYPVYYMTTIGKDRKEDYMWQAKSQWKGKEPIDYPIEIRIDMYFADARRRDWDNYHKITMDALNGLVWEDDHLIMAAYVAKWYKDDNPRIEISIYEASELGQ